MLGWYESMATAGFLMSLGLAWELYRLRRHIHADDLTPTKAWRKAIDGKRYSPTITRDRIPSGANANDLRFCREFAGVADLLNSYHSESPWSFQDTYRPERDHTGKLTREIVIRYNQQKTGSIEVSCRKFGHETYGDIRVQLALVNARIFDGHDVFGLAHTLATIVA